MRLVQPGGAGVQPAGNGVLLRLVVRARRWWRILRQGALDVTALAQREGMGPAYMTRVLRLAFLSPAVAAALLGGQLRAEVAAGTLTATGAVPACWREQATVFIPATAPRLLCSVTSNR